MSLGMSYKPNLHQNVQGTSVNQGKEKITVRFDDKDNLIACKFRCCNEYLGKAHVCSFCPVIYIGSDPAS